MAVASSRLWGAAPPSSLLLVVMLTFGASACSSVPHPPPPVASVGTDAISRQEVGRLATDRGFLAFIGVEGAPPTEKVETSEAGRKALTWLIQREAVEDELARHDIEVDPAMVRKVEDELGRGQVGFIPDDAIDHVDPIAEGPQHAVALGIAAYRTLDAYLRTLDPDDPATRDQIIDTFDGALDRVCGPVIAVDTTQEAAVRTQIDAGTPLELIGDRVPTRARTGAGFPACIVAGETPQALAELVADTELGTIGVTSYVNRSDGATALFFFRPDTRDVATGDQAEAAARNIVTRLRAEGVPAFYDLALPDIRPSIDHDWGEWDPVRGVTSENRDPSYETIVPPPTTTSTTPTTIVTTRAEAIPASVNPGRFGTEAGQIAGSTAGDPGTADLKARATAALNLAIRDDWQMAVPVRVSIIQGATSLSYPDGRLEVGSAHASGDWARLQAIMAHEFGHHIAFHYGTQATLGAAPPGWPSSGKTPVERWADCIARDFTGYPLGSHRDAPCDGPSFTWTVDWTAPDPSTWPRTR